MECHSEPLCVLLGNVERRRRIGEPDLLIVQAQALGVVVGIRNVTKVHVVHILVAQVPVPGEPPKVLHLCGVAA